MSVLERLFISRPARVGVIVAWLGELGGSFAQRFQNVQRNKQSMLATLPLKTLTERGFTIAFAVLLDTFIVRSLLVPVLDSGPRVWWPSALPHHQQTRTEADLDDRAPVHPTAAPAGLAANKAAEGTG